MEEKEHGFLHTLYRAFGSHNPKDPLSLFTDILYIIIIGVSVVFTVLEVTEVWARHEQVFTIFEHIIVALFVIEWIAEFLIVDVEYPELPFFKRKLKWVLSLESIVDLICLAIFACTIIFEEQFKQIAYLQLITLLKLVRLYKFHKYRAYADPRKKKEKK